MKRLLFLIPLLFLFWGSPPEEAVLFLVAVAIHESGHLAMLFYFKVPIKSFALTPFGAHILTEDPYLSYRKEIAVFLSGPLAGIAAAMGLIPFIRMHLSSAVLYFFFCNLFLSAVNLLPASSLDGGGALFSFLCLVCREETARRISFFADRATLVFLGVSGVILVCYERNPTLLLLAASLAAGEKEKKPRKVS